MHSFLYFIIILTYKIIDQENFVLIKGNKIIVNIIRLK